MLFYIVLGLILFLLSFLKYDRQIYWSTFFVLFLLFIGRDLFVGTDTINYLNLFLHDCFPDRGGAEALWNNLSKIILRLDGNFRIVLLIGGFLVLFPVFWVAKRVSVNPFLSIAIFVLLFFYCTSMNTIRQAIAVSIMLMSFYFFCEKKRAHAIICCLIAVSFHLSAIIPFIIFFFCKFSYNKRIVVICILLSFVIGVMDMIQYFLSLIVEAWFPFYEIYLNNPEYSTTNLFSITRLMLSLWVVLIVILSKRKDPYVNQLWIGIVFINLFAFSPVVARMAQFFLISQILVIPNLSTLIFDRFQLPMRLASYVYIWTIYCYFLFHNIGEVVPYKFDFLFF